MWYKLDSGGGQAAAAAAREAEEAAKWEQEARREAQLHAQRERSCTIEVVAVFCFFWQS